MLELPATRPAVLARRPESTSLHVRPLSNHYETNWQTIISHGNSTLNQAINAAKHPTNEALPTYVNVGNDKASADGSIWNN